MFASATPSFRPRDAATVAQGAQTSATDDNASPSIAAVAVEFPKHRHSQDVAIAELADFAGPEFHRFAAHTGVETRNFALPLPQYRDLNGFTDANNAYIDVALELGEQALLSALDAAKVKPSEVDIIFSTTVTGIVVPSLDARIATLIGLRPDVKRVPLFGLGCVAGAAGIARMNDYLRAYPGQVAALLAVELCSLTVQREDRSIANLIAACLFGDGAAAVIAVGGSRATAGPKLVAARSHTYPDTHEVLGWKVGSDGFGIVLSAEVAQIVEKYLGEHVRKFLAEYGMGTADVTTWIVHAAGPKVIDAVENALDLPAQVLSRTRKSLRDNGNLSSVSVLDILSGTMADPPPPGSLGLIIAMGPGFSSELVLLRW